MKKKTKTQEAVEYIESRGTPVVSKNKEYYVDGRALSAHALRRHARAVCLDAIAEEASQQLGRPLRVTNPWFPSIEDSNGMHIDVWRVLEERSGVTLDPHSHGGIKAAIIDGFTFGYSLSDLGVQVKVLRQETDGSWSAILPLVWAPKRGFLQDWQTYRVTYHSSPKKTIIMNGSNEVFVQLEQWVALDRIANLICFV